jgi:uncharacterized surface protein with fasciclin (FAS1) repeats
MKFSTWIRTSIVAVLIATVAVFGYVLPSRADVEGPDDQLIHPSPAVFVDLTSERSLAPEAVVAQAAGNIVQTAIEAGRFTTLVKAVQAADLVQTLSGPGPFTVFAPTDEAFAKLPAGTLESLLQDRQKLAAILTYHVVAGSVPASEVTKLTSATTVNGQNVTISMKDGAVMVDDARVIMADVMASNGIIHVIDTVILPK